MRSPKACPLELLATHPLRAWRPPARARPHALVERSAELVATHTCVSAATTASPSRAGRFECLSTNDASSSRGSTISDRDGVVAAALGKATALDE
jgi:hypothetical protein